MPDIQQAFYSQSFCKRNLKAKAKYLIRNPSQSIIFLDVVEGNENNDCLVCPVEVMRDSKYQSIEYANGVLVSFE
jgi:hypothetical protein